MKEIILENVCRSYRVPVKEKSFAGYLFRRRYRLLEAVKDISFSIGAGETVGLVGPNGAGKSTTIKMLTGVLTPDSGTVRVFGRDPFAERKENAIYVHSEGENGNIRFRSLDRELEVIAE